jgi:hypothetical protein
MVLCLKVLDFQILLKKEYAKKADYRTCLATMKQRSRWERLQWV